jgi:hypothetical protein
MSSPFIFIATNRLKPGRLERERRRVPRLVEFIEASEPRVIAFNEYVNEAGDEVTVVQFHPDAESMEAHMAIVRERAQEAYADTLDATVRIQVFGRPTDAIFNALRHLVCARPRFSVWHVQRIGPYPLRLTAATRARAPGGRSLGWTVSEFCRHLVVGVGVFSTN